MEPAAPEAALPVRKGSLIKGFSDHDTLQKI